jgi:hypothetical protein
MIREITISGNASVWGQQCSFSRFWVNVVTRRPKSFDVHARKRGSMRTAEFDPLISNTKIHTKKA